MSHSKGLRGSSCGKPRSIYPHINAQKHILSGIIMNYARNRVKIKNNIELNRYRPRVWNSCP